MPLAFINYRRSDTQQAAQALYDQLGARFGLSKVFLDVGAILPGVKWPQRIRQALSDSNVVLVVIGPRWLTASNEHGKRRIDDRKDWVRCEIIHALGNNKTIIPILVAGAIAMPVPAALPAPIRPLIENQWLQLRDEKWDEDLQGLIGRLERDHGFVDNQNAIRLPTPRKNLRALTAEEVEAAIESMPGWATVESVVPKEYPKVRQELRRIYAFKTFKSAIDFMHRSIETIDAMDHHPRWENQWKTVTVYLTIWDIGSRISEVDVKLAKALDDVYRRKS